MKKNEDKPKEAAAVAKDAPADANAPVNQEQSAAKAEEPAAEADVPVTEELVEGPHILSDDPTAEAVTILVMLTCDDDNAFMLRHSLRSLSRFLRGVSAEVKVIGREKPDWLPASAWLDVSDATDTSNWNSLVCRATTFVNTERIVLMTDRMFLIRPVNLADIAVLKAEVGTLGNKTIRQLYDLMGTTKREVWNYHTNMPALFFKSTLLQVIDYMFGHLKGDDFDLPTAYFNLIYPELRPTLLDWSHDGWLLPIVSEHPDIERAKTFFETKKFMHVASRCWQEVVSLLKFLTPDPSPFEADTENENSAKD